MVDFTYYTGKNILITGAASGLGKELALKLCRYADKLVLLDLNSEGLEQVADQCRGRGSYIRVYSIDLLADHPLRDIREKEGCPDIIFANAGVGGVNPANGFDEEIDARIMGINYFGVVKTLAPYLQQMSQRKSGHIVGISSLAGIRGLPGASSYSASKAALNNFLESLRLDLAPFNVKVTTILPGFLETPMADHKEFSMPFKVTAEKSALNVLWATAKGKKKYAFPRIMGCLSLFNKLLPVFLYDRLLPIIAGQSKDLKPRIFQAKK